eukprot:TRINITY_DN5118_c0_g1_i1.p1 TRINITY_DN5118_c0_g1~~TRINITY_DN5118_c0_g1_i1.p1  ORF type:complete len:273 (+),score=58.17 TRINITY_DN5118_c0_g1_i1:96-914(+)
MRFLSASLWGISLACILMLAVAIDDEKLIGWKGEVSRGASSGLRGGMDGKEEAELKPWVEVLAWEPRAFLYHNFLTPKECLHLIHAAAPHMVKSTVVDSATGKSKDSRVRTSSGTFLRRGQDDVIKDIEKRIAAFTFIPEDHGEGLQVLHYEEGQKYEAHYDYFHDTINTKNGGQRIATLLMYLSDVEKGGETVFPASQADGNREDLDQLSECAKAGVSVRPKRGDALLFWSLTPEAKLDPKALHGGCPVIIGSKWSSTKWMRVHPYGTTWR